MAWSGLLIWPSCSVLGVPAERSRLDPNYASQSGQIVRLGLPVEVGLMGNPSKRIPPMTHAVERIDHVEVYVRDVETAAAWYQKVLGLEEVFRCDPFPVMIGTRGSKIALFQAPRDGPDNSDDDTQPPIRWRRVAWLVTSDRFAAAQDHLRACGVAFDRHFPFAASDAAILRNLCPISKPNDHSADHVAV